MADQSSSRQQLIFYDRDCGFCRYLVARVLRWDRAHDSKLMPMAIQAAGADGPLARMDETERLASWHLELPSGEVISAGAALPIVLELVNRHRNAARLFRRYPAFTERGYRWVVEHRSTLGKITRRWASLRGVPYPPVVTEGDGDITTCSIS